jgi:hypothetical protein
MAYRAFYLGATTELEYRQLVNQPTLKAQFFAAASTPQERAAQAPPPPPQVINAGPPTLASSGPVASASPAPANGPSTTGLAGQKQKRQSKGVTTPTPDGSQAAKAPTPSPSKRNSKAQPPAPPPEPVDSRAASVRLMLAEAQRQAQQTQVIMQTYKQSGGVGTPGSPTAAGHGSMGFSANGPGTPPGGTGQAPSKASPTIGSNATSAGGGVNVKSPTAATSMGQLTQAQAQALAQNPGLFAHLRQQQAQAAKIAQVSTDFCQLLDNKMC